MPAGLGRHKVKKINEQIKILDLQAAFKWKESHEVRMMYNIGFNRSLYMVPLPCMGCNDMANFRRHPAGFSKTNA